MSAVEESWEQLRSHLRLGQRLTGTVVWVPRPGGIGIGVDVGLAVGGLVDVLMLPLDVSKWPTVGTRTEFEVWWLDQRPRIRLKPVDPGYLRDDFDAWARTVRSPAAACLTEPADPGR